MWSHLPTPSNLGNFPVNSAFLYDQKVGDQFTLKVCFEMYPHFWTKSIKIIKFHMGLGLKFGLIASSGVPLTQTESVQYAPMQTCICDNVFNKLYCRGEGGAVARCFILPRGKGAKCFLLPGGWRGGK